jgi:transcriptional regulator with XRE-family HTH domain
MPHRPSKDYVAIEEGAKLIARLHWHLEISGETQRSAAKRIGVPQATLHRWLFGRMSPDSESRVKIRKFLNSAEE